jgi:dTDP-4-dehydrorhamnose reductase
MSINRVLVIGSNGLLGQKVAELLIRGSNYGITLASVEAAPVRDLLSAEYVQMDITSRKEVREVVGSSNPDVIINCAAMTNVDACETERELAWKINVNGVENIIDAARKNATRVFHVSSDYVFDGKTGPYSEDDRPAPLSYYGKSKLASENALLACDIPFFIARTMVLYGFAGGVKANFALWLIQSLRDRQKVRVVDDQYGNPTLVDDLAFGIIRAMEMGRTGIYNLAGRDIISRYEFAQKLAQVFHLDASLIQPIKTSQLHQPAARPLKSGLITLKAEVELGYKPSTAEEGLRMLKMQLRQADQWRDN